MSKISKTKRIGIFIRDGNICLCCGTTKNLTVDHIIPKSIGGSKKGKNLQTLCKVCNNIKGNKIIKYRESNNVLRYIQSFLKHNNISLHTYNKRGLV